MKKRTGFIALLSVFAISGATAGAAMISGCNKIAGTIDAPATLEEELGAYVIPDYEVVDSNGMILAGYNVYLKSVKNADGEELAESYGSAVTVDEAGVYRFVYSAGSKKVKDVTVEIDFADRTAPTINCDDSAIPEFYIKGNSYKVPQYTLSGDFDRSRCWAKVYHIADDKKETDVKVDGGRFLVDKDGSYAIRIHVEDAVGNANDYEYVRNVDGPENAVENKVLYLDEEFGERQVSCYQSAYTGEYVSKDEDGAHVYSDEKGAYKVSFNNTETRYNEGCVVMDVPAIIDVNEYEELYMYVYNDSDNEIIMGSMWWNDTKVPAKQWTKLTWNTRAWGNNMSANNTKPVGLIDISGMTIRFIFAYDQSIKPNGTFYLSAMYATPKVVSELEAGENVILNASKFYVNDTVELNAAPIDGKTVDCYKVDGKIIPGNSFIVTQEHHTIEVVYKDGELTKDNMTWASPDELNPSGGDVKTQYMGNDEYWVMSYDVHGVESGWHHFGVYVGGSNQLLGFELVNNTGKLCGYGGAWKWGDGIQLTPLDMWILQSATETKPVRVTYVRRGNEIRVFLDDHFVGAVDFSEFGVSGNNFGFGARATGNNLPSAAVIENFSAVAGEKKTNLYFEEFSAELTIDGVKAEGKHYMGDKVVLTAGEAPEDKMFAYFKVNGERIRGNEFYIPTANTVVETVYTDIVTVVLAEGIKTEDGKTGTVKFAQDSYVVLDYTGTTPPGKYYIGFTVDGEEINGNEILITADTHGIGVLFGDKIQTGGEKLNDISDTEKLVYAVKDDGETVKWNPASVEHVTDFRYGGTDGAVDEDSVLKIVTGTDGGENSFAFNSALVDNLDAYKEIYFYVYTEVSGLKAGGWWCNDTNLVAGKWTRVSFRRTDATKPGTIDGNGDTKVWEEGINKFAFRIFSAPAGTTVYVTAVYGLPYADVEVTAADGVTVSDPANGKTYKEGETVTLIADEAPEGKVFAYFTANGEPLDGNKFKLTGKVEFGVVYNEFSTITLADGIETDGGQTGTFRVARNVPVYLKLTDETKYYLAFSVDGEEIKGNSFTPTEGKTYSVTVTVENRVSNGNSQLSDVSSAAMHSGEAELDFTGHISYNGADGAVKADGSIKVSEIGGGDVAIKATKSVGEADLKNYKEVYFYIYTEADGVIAGTYWCNDVEAVKGQWTKVTVYQDMNKNSCVGQPYDADGVSGKLFAAGSKGSNFVYRIQGGAGKTVYLTSLYGVPFADATVKIAEDSKDSLTVSDPANGTQYKEGETVTLIAGEAPEGKAFAYFTADGEPIDGDEFTLKVGEVTFGVVYSEISVITFGTGVTAEHAEDGKLTVGRGATVHIVFNGEIPAGKYFAGFKVDGEPIDGDAFTAEGAAHSVEAVFEVKEQTGNVKLNEISTVAEDGLSYHVKNTAWNPEKIEYVTNVKYTGKDGAVDESGSLKVTLNSGEQAFALNKTLINKLDEYKEIYFYVYAEKDTDVSGAIAGGWWCNDTAIVAGQWTKVSFTRAVNPQNISEKSVWAENSIDKFTYRFNKAKEGTTVYVTAVYGVLYEEVSVTVDDSVKEYIEVNGTFREGQTITLSHTGAPENKQFVYFTINGERYDKDAYTLGTEAIEVGAYFTDAKATLTLGAGVNTADGEKVYALGETVTLKIDGETAPANKVFDRFEVDGKPIKGDTFVTSSTTHKVEAIFIDNAVDMTWNKTAFEEPETDIGGNGKYKVIDSAANWVLSYDITATNADSTANAGIPNQWYAGVLFRNNQLVGFHMGDNSEHSQWLGSAGSGAGTTWDVLQPSLGGVLDILKNADKETVTLIFIRQGNKLSSYVKCKGETYLVLKDKVHEAFDTNYGLDFGYGWRTGCGGNPDIDNIEWVTGEGKTGLYIDSLKADISYTKASAEKEVYRLGDTVALTADEAETGKKFLQFTVNGEPIDGNTFEVKTTETYEVVAVYSDVAEITLGTGVKTADGQTKYAIGATVTLAVDSASAPADKIIDYFTVGGERIVGNKFVVEDSAYSVGAVFVNPSEMTWTNGGSAYNYETVMGSASAEWKSRNLDGEVYGSSEYWAVSVNVKHTSEWNSFEFILGSKQSLRVRFHNGNFCGIILMVDGKETKPGTEFTDAYPTVNPKVVEKLVAGATITCIRLGDTLKLYADGLQFFKTSCAFDHTGDWFGVGHVYNEDAGKATKPEMTETKFLTLREKVEAYDGELKALPGAQQSAAQINSIQGATATDPSTVEYVTSGIPAGLEDASIQENGVLKVTAASNEVGITPSWTFDNSKNNFSEIYFWVYLESENQFTALAGIHWASDNKLETNKWVKVIVRLNELGEAENGLSKLVLRVAEGYYEGHQSIAGKTFYITSVYGVPNDTDKLAENKSTSYSLVSSNDELTAIINDNFFPDAE